MEISNRPFTERELGILGMQLQEYRRREALRPEWKYIILSLLLLGVCLAGIAWSGGHALLSIIALLDVFFLLAYLYGRPKDRRQASVQAAEVEGMIDAGTVEVSCFHCTDALRFELEEGGWAVWALQVGDRQVLLLEDRGLSYHAILPARTFEWVRDPVAHRHFSLAVTKTGERFLPTIVPKEAIGTRAQHYLLGNCGTPLDTTLDELLEKLRV